MVIRHKGGENIKRKVLISLTIICFICLSINFTYASDNETDFNQDIISSNINDTHLPEALNLENSMDDDVIASEEYNVDLGSGKTIEITQDNYDNYFNARTGKIIENSGISSGDTLKIGNISNRAFVIDRQLTIMPISQGDEISNGFIHLVQGSDGSTVTNLIINNTKGTLTVSGVNVGQLHGIWLTKSNNNTIAYNTIRIANTGGVYAMPMGWSSNNRIVYNDMKTYISSVIIMGQSHYNLISHNSLEVLSYSDMSVTNLIYFNPFGHADYSGSPLCLGNIISYNYLKGFCNSPMSIILQMTYDSHDGTVVANNTIIKGSFGVNLNGRNLSVYGNVVNNSGAGIVVSGNNFTVSDNAVFGDSQGSGISVFGSSNSNCEVKNNNMTFKDVSFGLYVSTSEAHDNIVNIAGYGVGISVEGDESAVYGNKIRTNHDSGISVVGSSNSIKDNVIVTNKYGISIPTESSGNMYFNNSLTSNRITSDDYGIYITGLVYNTTIKDNSITTNASTGIFKQITDEQSNTEEDNVVNGVILKSTAIVIDDDNYDDYFDGYGNFKYDLGDNRVIILTFLTNKNLIFSDKVKLISNKRSNLLYNVTITLQGDAEESLIEGLNFVNNGRKAIHVNQVSNINITSNNITEIFKKGSYDDSSILIQGVCDNLNVVGNNIYVNSKLNYTYAISAISTSFNGKLSRDALIKDNTIIMISYGVCEALYTDMLSDSDFISNRINIMADDYSYGLAFANVVGRLSGLNVSFNDIIIHSKQMAYLIEFHMIDNSTISNNVLHGQSNGIYGIGIYSSNNISIANNSLSVFGGDLSDINGSHDVLGIGNSAIAIIKNTNNTLIMDNLIHANSNHPISQINLTEEYFIQESRNYHVLDDDNYHVYFNDDGELREGMIGPEDVLLLYNLTKNQILKINQKITISSYDRKIPATVTIEMGNKASQSKILNISFVNSTIQLNDASQVMLCNNSLSNTAFNINSGKDNRFINNAVACNTTALNPVNINDAERTVIESNQFNITSNEIIVVNMDGSYSTRIKNNTMLGTARDLIFINSLNSNSDEISENTIAGEGSSVVAYKGSNVKNVRIDKNDVRLNGTEIAAIYFEGQSKSNEVSENSIISFSRSDDDYAVMVKSDEGFSNVIIKNYLISSNGLRMADGAVMAPYDTVHSNTPADVYVSMANGSDVSGDGSKEKPYASISKAIENALNHSTIHIHDGTYIESKIDVDKEVFIFSVNPGRVIIDANQSQLFNIGESGLLSVNGVQIRNAHNVDGGSAFINNGQLIIENSVICNSSSFYDNSRPVWENITYEDNGEINHAFTEDCRNTGVGGAILNRGTMTISKSSLYNNIGHWGGAIADFGKTAIDSSVFYNNVGVHGGVIYSNADNPLTIQNSSFENNTALKTIDYCALRLYTTGWSIDEGNHHQVESICNTPIGSGGVIYTNSSLLIENSEFKDNSASYGGVVAAIVDSFNSQSNYVSKIDLEIKNSTFINNRANDTRHSLADNDLSSFPYTRGYDGGVVYGTFNRCYITDSGFYNNQAMENGGALYAKANDGQILDSVFAGNIAGLSAGALDLSKNFIIMRTIISNNSARYGGALQYNSYSYYGHIQDSLNIYNSTISNNKALNRGGAFDFGTANVVIHDSNIVGNVAPSSNTIHSSSSSYAIDMTHNYWGINNGRNGPDDSVWAVSKSQFRPWYREWINWTPEISGPETTNPESNDGDGGNGNGNGKSKNINPTSTGSSASTKSSISSGGGNWGYDGNGDGSNRGYGGIGDGHNGAYGALGLNSYHGQNIKGNANMDIPSSSVDSRADGNVNRDSLSKTNGSTYNPNLQSIGMTSNAAAVSSSSQGYGGSSADSQQGESVVKSYEINEKIDEMLSDDKSFMIFIALALTTLILLVIGYRRNDKEEEEY